MNWQEKAAALFALGGDPSIRMRKVGDWYVYQDVVIKDGAYLRNFYGNGATPQGAIENHWKVLVEDLEDGQYLLVMSHSRRKAVKWNGHAWVDIKEAA